jgi:ZIP family zinc transporter
MSPLLLAGLAGLLSGLSLVVGSLVAWFVKVPREVVALVMAFGAGVLISALAFDLVDEAAASGGVVPTLGGFVAGAVVYVVLDQILEHGGFRRKHHGKSGGGGGTGVGIALGALLDGVPETAVQGLSLTGGGALSIGVLVAVVISNFPEGMSSTADLKENGRSARYVFGLWTSIAVICALSSLGRDGVRGRRDPRDDLRHHDPRGVPQGPGAHRPRHGARLRGELRGAPGGLIRRRRVRRRRACRAATR